MGGKFICKKNPLQDLLSSLNCVISINERNGISTDHVIFKLGYNEIYQMKTTNSKKCAPKLVFFTGKEWRKILMIFDIEN